MPNYRDGVAYTDGAMHVTISSGSTLPAHTVSGLLTLSSGQLAFPATQNASADANTLDDYEEGVFVPAITFGGAAVGLTYTTQLGRYTKIGRLVQAVGWIVVNDNGTSVGAAVITDLPFTCNATLNAPIFLRLAGVPFTGQAQGMVVGNSNTIALSDISEAGAVAVLDDTNIVNSASIMFCAVYSV